MSGVFVVLASFLASAVEMVEALTIVLAPGVTRAWRSPLIGVGLAVHQPLSRVPENTLKFAVGLMLSTFGTFWAVEGAGGQWPGSDAAILGILVVYSAISFVYVRLMRTRRAEALSAA